MRTPHYYPWQTTQWKALLSRWRNNNLPHALLLSGPKDLGKLAFTQMFAARLFCQQNSLDAELACGTCQSCQWLQAGTHPDLYTLQPHEDSDILKIGQIRELLASLQQTAQHASQQVVIIEPAESMNRAGSNALLKMLEEPTGSVTFLLISHQPGNLAATIRSRCQKIDFPVPPLTISLDWLEKQLPAQKSNRLLLALSENIPLRAIQFAEASLYNMHNELVEQFIRLSMGDLSPLKIATTCTEISATQVYEGLCLLLLDIARLQRAPGSGIAHVHQLNALNVIAARVSSLKLFHFFDQLLEIKKHLNTKIHLNMQMMWEGLFIGWLEDAR